MSPIRLRLLVRRFKQRKILAVSRWTMQGRFGHPQPAEPGVSLHESLEFLQYPPMNGRIANHTRPAAGFGATGFELRFDEGDDAPARPKQAGGGLQESTQRNEGTIDGHQIRCLKWRWEPRRGQMPRVGSFHDDHTRILTEFPRQLALTDIDGMDTDRAVLQQAIGESTGRCPEVHSRKTSHIESELPQGMLEFLAAPADIAFPRLDPDRVARLDPGRRFCGRLFVDANLAGEDDTLSLFAAVDQAAFNQHSIETVSHDNNQTLGADDTARMKSASA